MNVDGKVTQIITELRMVRKIANLASDFYFIRLIVRSLQVAVHYDEGGWGAACTSQ